MNLSRFCLYRTAFYVYYNLCLIFYTRSIPYHICYQFPADHRCCSIDSQLLRRHYPHCNIIL